MINHLYYTELDNFSSECAPLSDLKYFVREDKELDILIAQQYPLSSFGALDDMLKIKGSQQLIEAFEKIRAKKFDVNECLENIEYMGLTDSDDIILNFKNDGWSATGIYSFTYDFFDDFFDMGRFAAFCIKNGYTDLLRENLNRLFEELKDSEKQFRLLQKGDDIFLRGLTSIRYQNYDNNIALYLSMLYLHKFAAANDVSFRVSYARLSDSEIQVFFEQEQHRNIPGVGDLYFGIVVSNSEVREGAVSLELRYRLVNDQNVSFAAIPNLKDSVFNINHITSVDKIEKKLERLNNLKAVQDSMFTLVSGIKGMKTLSKDAMFSLYKKIVFSKNFKAETRTKFIELYDQNDVDNAVNLVEAFEKINRITTDFDERVFLERIYHELITELTQKRAVSD